MKKATRTQAPRAKSKSVGRLVIVANRLPVSLEKKRSGWKAQPSPGGLVTALTALFRDRGGLWVGWPGIAGEPAGCRQALKEAGQVAGFEISPVLLSQEEIDKFYLGFSNEVLWPLFHDFVDRCHFDPGYWAAYREVNARYAHTMTCSLRPDDFLWIHDYQLIDVAGELRRREVKNPLAFFLHIPFPPVDNFIKLPWRAQILHALLAYDLLGFQTLRDRRNFIHGLRLLIPDVRVRGSGQVVTVQAGRRKFRVGSFPIGIDFDEFSSMAAREDVAARALEIKKGVTGRKLVLGMDRLDYSKGIPQRIRAFESTLEHHPELAGKVSFFQVVVPSRQIIPEYQSLLSEIEQLVGHVNGRFARSGWVPIQYFYANYERAEVVAHYLAADVMLVTPLKDGMNLVAKEYCAAHVDMNGVLVLSEFAGAAAQLQRGALLVNPFDIEGMGAAIHEALTLPPAERRMRMMRLRRTVRRESLAKWVDSFLQAAIAKDLSDFPRLQEMDEYVPSMGV